MYHYQYIINSFHIALSVVKNSLFHHKKNRLHEFVLLIPPTVDSTHCDNDMTFAQLSRIL